MSHLLSSNYKSSTSNGSTCNSSSSTVVSVKESPLHSLSLEEDDKANTQRQQLHSSDHNSSSSISSNYRGRPHRNVSFANSEPTDSSQRHRCSSLGPPDEDKPQPPMRKSSNNNDVKSYGANDGSVQLKEQLPSCIVNQAITKDEEIIMNDVSNDKNQDRYHDDDTKSTLTMPGTDDYIEKSVHNTVVSTFQQNSEYNGDNGVSKVEIEKELDDIYDDLFDEEGNRNRVSRHVATETVLQCQKEEQQTQKSVKGIFEDLDQRDTLAPFALHEIELGTEPLGHGQFSNVYEIKGFTAGGSQKSQLKTDDERFYSLTPAEIHARQFLKKHALRKPKKQNNQQSSPSCTKSIFPKSATKPVARYALKYLRPQLMEDPKFFMVGARDLVKEVQLLAAISHPHIIRVRGSGIDGSQGYSSGSNKGYFLIFDRLQETLRDRLYTWDKKQKLHQNKVTKLFYRKAKRRKFFESRCKVCFDLAGALSYLHDHHIMYRDLKLDNIGFDVRGDVKLFDFGLAKIMPPNTEGVNQKFQLSAAGTPRYMAPEVARGEMYNMKADVYGFALICWSILAVNVPFSTYDKQMLLDGVINGGLDGDRPRIGKEWPSSIQWLLETGWSYDPFERPTMKECYKLLSREVIPQRGGKPIELSHANRRSTYVPNFSQSKSQQ